MRDPEMLFTWFNEVGIISQLATRLFERVLPDGLTQSQFSVLNWFIRVDDVATPARLATAFQVTRGAMTNTLKKLADKNLVVVAPDASNGRQKLVRITPEGRALRAQAIAASGPLLSELAADIETAALAEQLPVLQSLRQYLDDYRYREPSRD